MTPHTALGNILRTPAVWPYVICSYATPGGRPAAAAVCSGEILRITYDVRECLSITVFLLIFVEFSTFIGYVL